MNYINIFSINFSIYSVRGVKKKNIWMKLGVWWWWWCEGVQCTHKNSLGLGVSQFKTPLLYFQEIIVFAEWVGGGSILE